MLSVYGLGGLVMCMGPVVRMGLVMRAGSMPVRLVGLLPIRVSIGGIIKPAKPPPASLWLTGREYRIFQCYEESPNPYRGGRPADFEIVHRQNG